MSTALLAIIMILIQFKNIVNSEEEYVEWISCQRSHCNAGYVRNSKIIPKSNIISSHESTDYTTDLTHIHVKCKGKKKSHFTPEQHIIMHQPGWWTQRWRLWLVQRWRYQREWTRRDRI
jgi:hypothetical protein